MSVYESFNYPEVTLEAAREMGLTECEFEGVQKLLGRTPNYIELVVFISQNFPLMLPGLYRGREKMQVL